MKTRILLALFFTCALCSLAGASPFPKGAKRILFLGNSITYAGTYVTDMEAYLVTHYPKQQYEFINTGLPSETVSGLSEVNHADGRFPRPDLHERLSRVLAQTKPDVVFACYGMNDGIYLPLDNARFGAYREGMKWLHAQLEKAGAKRIVFLTPPTHDDSKQGLEGYNRTLDAYARWLLAQRDSLQWEVADVHFPMNQFLIEKRKTEPSFKLANDGVHPGEAGHWLMARAVLQYLGETVAEAPDVLSALRVSPRSEEILSLVSQRQALMKDAWLTATGHKRPEMATGLPLSEARQVYDQIERQLRATVQGKAPQRIRIACVGNSITYGARLSAPAVESYPAQLQRLLGYTYDVRNFGVSGRTLMSNTENPYTATPSYKQALASQPDIVTIKLGTNDSRLPYRLTIADRFVADYKALIQAFKQLPTHPRIVLLLPVASYLTDTTRQIDAVIAKQIIPRIQQVAYEEKVELIDLHSITLQSDSLFPDQLHPNRAGATLIAQRLFEAISRKPVAEFDIFRQLSQPYQVSSFYGYDCADFTFNGRTAKIVKPRVVAEGKPWIWRARFWGHEPQTDIALLDRGFHVVYCDPAELFGNSEAVDLWNKFYAYLHRAGLAKKAVLEGMSRGGVYDYNWAAQNPDKVACVYADAPVLDLRSWPGGKGKSKGSPADWEKLREDYGYKTEAETETFRNSPLDKVTDIVKGHYPMLHVVGDADELVPVEENTAPFEEKIKKLGGTITVIHKPGVHHHPHSLANPQPIVNFILAAVYGNTGLQN
ncbi:GDSL-type esterase/lipase family protein [Spirosoma sp. SC4-14]|uniref:GDSL-type esterase/lipase family protein n=1 Tax=Spirosoma sp. SC4-14 TaxID=3128900 RepID=UPI0030CEEEA2